MSGRPPGPARGTDSVADACRNGLRLGVLRPSVCSYVLPRFGFNPHLYQGGVQLSSLGLVFQNMQGALQGYSFFVGSVVGHQGIKDIRDGHHARAEGDSVAHKTLRVPTAIELLMVPTGD